MTLTTSEIVEIVKAALRTLVERYLDECPRCAFLKSPCSFHYWLCYESMDQLAASIDAARASEKEKPLLRKMSPSDLEQLELEYAAERVAKEKP